MAASPRYLTQAQVAALIEERDTLLEHVRQLQAALAPSAVLPRSWGLTPTEERLLRALRATGPNVLHQERAMMALYGTSDDAPEQRIIDTMISRIRGKLMRAEAGVEIETIPARGWRMTAESCARFDDLVAADLARWTSHERAA